jgi:hypothetical protein
MGWRILVNFIRQPMLKLRSHAVLQVIVKQQNRVRNTLQEIRVGKLFMIDLAGSERAANTGFTFSGRSPVRELLYY